MAQQHRLALLSAAAKLEDILRGFFTDERATAAMRECLNLEVIPAWSIVIKENEDRRELLDYLAETAKRGSPQQIMKFVILNGFDNVQEELGKGACPIHGDHCTHFSYTLDVDNKADTDKPGTVETS